MTYKSPRIPQAACMKNPCITLNLTTIDVLVELLSYDILKSLGPPSGSGGYVLFSLSGFP
jgi:hypothetical protein